MGRIGHRSASTPTCGTRRTGILPAVRRHLFNLAALLSLLLCVAVAVLWVRSYWVATSATWHHQPVRDGESRTVRLETKSGRFILWGRYSGSGREIAIMGWYWSVRPIHSHETAATLDRFWRGQRGRVIFFMGFCYSVEVGSTAGVVRWSERRLMVPLWALCLVSSILPLLWLRRRVWHTHPAGHCQSCGYDLRETPERCPECGEAVVANG